MSKQDKLRVYRGGKPFIKNEKGEWVPLYPEAKETTN